MTFDPKQPTIEDLARIRGLIVASDLIPLWMRNSLSAEPNYINSTTIEEKLVKRDYLDFLEQQIELEPRGPEWTSQLQRWLNALAPYEGQPLLRWNLICGRYHGSIRVTPDYKTIVLVDDYELSA